MAATAQPGSVPAVITSALTVMIRVLCVAYQYNSQGFIVRYLTKRLLPTA